MSPRIRRDAAITAAHLQLNSLLSELVRAHTHVQNKRTHIKMT